MYKVKDTVFSDAGYILKKPNFVGYSCPGELSDFTEVKLDLSKFSITAGMIHVDDVIIGKYDPSKTYADYKTVIIKGRYSNDDQIAIMLNMNNSKEDLERYNKMQEWRQWAGDLAQLIIQ